MSKPETMERGPERCPIISLNILTRGMSGSDLARHMTTQWGLPTMACGHSMGQLIRRKDGKYICSHCGI